MKIRKKCGLLPNRGGVSEGSKMPNLYFGKVFFQLACRIILGPSKHLLHLVWSCLDVYQALKTTLKVLVNSYFMLANSGRIMTINIGNLFIFEVGPSVNFFLAVTEAIFNKKIGVNFLFGNWLTLPTRMVKININSTSPAKDKYKEHLPSKGESDILFFNWLYLILNKVSKPCKTLSTFINIQWVYITVQGVSKISRIA